jgi:hypothetical protein
MHADIISLLEGFTEKEQITTPFFPHRPVPEEIG